MTQAWHRAIAFALTGEELDLPTSSAPNPGALLAQLADAGWARVRIAEHAHAASGWPHPVPDALRAGLGAAQLFAALGRAREELGVAVLDPRPPSGRTALTADERRLLADVPPHHVPH